MNRREFIAMSSMATFASALGEDIKRKEPLRVAVVGLGRKGMDVLSNLFYYRAGGLIQADVKGGGWMAFLSARRISAIANRHWLSCNEEFPSTVSCHWQRRLIRLVKCCLLHRKRLSDCFVRLGLTGSHNTNTGGLN